MIVVYPSIAFVAFISRIQCHNIDGQLLNTLHYIEKYNYPRSKHTISLFVSPNTNALLRDEICGALHIDTKGEAEAEFHWVHFMLLMVYSSTNKQSYSTNSMRNG